MPICVRQIHPSKGDITVVTQHIEAQHEKAQQIYPSIFSPKMFCGDIIREENPEMLDYIVVSNDNSKFPAQQEKADLLEKLVLGWVKTLNFLKKHF